MNITSSAQNSMFDIQYSYDYDNRIFSTTEGTEHTEYLYGASSARIGRIAGGPPATTNYFVIDYTDGLKRPLAETDANGIVTRYYVWNGSQLLCHIEAVAGVPDLGSVRYYHTDELSSTLALTDSNGDVADEFAYMPYGDATHTAHAGSSDTPFLWLGRYGFYYDFDTDLHLTLHRAYSSSMKRFIHPDPLGIDGGVNVYAMANRNPLAFVDPTGLFTLRTGYTASINLGSAINLNIGLAIGFSWKDGFTGGISGGIGGGVGVPSASVGRFVEVTTAPNVGALQGGSIQAGGSATIGTGAGVVVGADGIVGLNDDGSIGYYGMELNVGVGAGAPVEVHVVAPLSFSKEIEITGPMK